MSIVNDYNGGKGKYVSMDCEHHFHFPLLYSHLSWYIDRESLGIMA